MSKHRIRHRQADHANKTFATSSDDYLLMIASDRQQPSKRRRQARHELTLRANRPADCNIDNFSEGRGLEGANFSPSPRPALPE